MTDQEILGVAYDFNALPKSCTDASLIAFARDMFSLGYQRALEKAVKKHTGSPRKLQKVGTGALHDEQQYCFGKGFKEGAASLRREIKGMI